MNRCCVLADPIYVRHFRTPYGALGWAYFVVTAFALLFFMLASFRCFLTVNKTDDYKVFVGYWGAENAEIANAAGEGGDHNYCISWSKDAKTDIFDGAWQLGRALGIIGSIIAIPFTLFSIYILVYRAGNRLFSVAVASHVAMSVISLLLLVGLGSDVCAVNNCKLGPGGYFALLAFFLWVLAAFLAFRLRSLSADEREHMDQGSDKPGNLPALPAPGDDERLSQKV